jgi:serine/threonine-protein kinase
MVGESIGNYRITSLLGEGGMGAVYVAEHPGIGRRVAVKVLLPALASDQEMVTRFFNEARAANAIHHPGIVEVLDFGTLASGASYIVMELLEGESLATRITRGGRLAPDAAVEVALQAAAALGAAHVKGIVHRDLKPDNLYLVPDQQNPGRERIKVLDFGIAKLADGMQAGRSSVKTRTGVIMGTPIYMSPEQCRGTRVIDQRSDLYALGVILFEMVCGTPPFVSDGQGELIHMHIAEPPPSPRRFTPELSLSLEAAILRALAKDPAQRFQSMEELTAVLRASLAPEAGPATGRALSPTVQAPQRTLKTPAPLEPQARAAAPVPTPARTLKLPDDEPAPAPAAPRPRPAGGRLPMTTLSGSAGPSATTPPPRSRALPLALGAVLVLGAGAAAVLIMKPWEPARTPGPAPPVAAGAPPAVSTPSALEPAPAVPTPPAVRSVSVRVASKPSGARLTRESDGAVLGVTPFAGSAPARAGTERVKVDLGGYVEELMVLPLDEDVDLTLSLKPSAAPAAEAAGKKHGHARIAPRPTPQARPTLQPNAAPTRQPTAEPVPL